MTIKSYFLSALCCIPFSIYAQQDNAKLHQLFDQYFKEGNLFNPMNATFNGVAGYNDLLPADDESFLKKKHDFYAQYLKRLKSFESLHLSKQDKISAAIMENDIESVLVLEQYHPEYLPITQFASVPSYFAMLGAGTSAQPFKTVKDYDDWLKRCGAYAHWIDVAIENMKKGIKSGYLLPKSLVIKVIPQLQALAKVDENSSFFSPIKNFPKDFSDADKKRLTEAFKESIPKNIFV